MNPRRWPGEYVFSSVASLDGIEPAEHIALIRETEGWTLISQRRSTAQPDDANTPCYAAITLEVNSALADIGLTAAISDTLATAGIACNVLAGFHHDHLFVPIERSEQALALLNDLQRTYSSTPHSDPA
ncbi:ACT domain-containing protein [Salinisphaera sp. SPP-AMP-43]|uniref:ACT domain-containing protein n=1 Tax=Salinisphaera sp. SPP-AMP-43 TaxID=3121288 RepID=UPI003C6E8A79